MELLSTFFNEALYRPLLNILFLFYQYVPGHDMGVAVILITLLIRFIFYPLGLQAIRAQKQTAEIQPKIKELQVKYKNDKEAQTKAIMDLYKEHKFNPFSGCLPLLVQFPFLIALYQIFLHGINSDAAAKLYSFVPTFTSLNPLFLGFVDLTHPNTVLAVLAGVAQFIQFKTMPQQKNNSNSGKPDIMQAMSKQMGFVFPIMALIICLTLPSAVALYWITTTVFSIAQQLLVFKKPKTNQ